MLTKNISLITVISYTDKNHKSDNIQNKSCYNYTVYCSLLLLTTLSFAVQSFKGVDILRLFNCSPVNPKGLIQTPPVSWRSMSLCSGCWFSFLCFPYSLFLMKGMKQPLYRWCVSLFGWVGAFCVREVDRHCPSSSHRLNLPISLPPLLCLALPTLTQFCEWLHSSWAVHYPPASMGIDVIPFTLCMCSFLRSASYITLPEVFTHPQWTLW